MFKKIAFLSFVLLFTALFTQGQNAGQQTDWNEQIQQLSFMNRTDSEYHLGSGDLIEVSVFGVEDYKYSLRINSRGEINLPFVGTLAVGGLTPAELEQELKVKFEDRLIRNPQVSVFVKEYRSQPVFILGAVKQPGQYQTIHRLNLVDVIAMAGGLDTEKAGDQALIQRREATTADPAMSSGPPQSNVLKVDLKKLLEEGELSLNIPIESGDVIQIPERKVELVYIIGDVVRPGAFELPADQDVLLTQALAQAGGPLKTAKLSKGMIIRYDEGGGRQELALDFKKVLEGKSPDVPISPNDVIFMPGSTAKNVGYGMLGMLPGLVSGSILWGAINPR